MHTTNRTVTVGQAARQTGLTPKAIRLYEARGLLAPAERTDSGYRAYAQRDIDVLCFSRRARNLGLRLTEIKDIIGLEDGSMTRCAHVLHLLDAHIAEIDRAVTDLESLRKTLSTMRDAASNTLPQGEPAAVCRIIEM